MPSAYNQDQRGRDGAGSPFVDADGADDIAGTIDDDLHLAPGSLAIDSERIAPAVPNFDSSRSTSTAIRARSVSSIADRVLASFDMWVVTTAEVRNTPRVRLVKDALVELIRSQPSLSPRATCCSAEPSQLLRRQLRKGSFEKRSRATNSAPR